MGNLQKAIRDPKKRHYETNTVSFVRKNSERETLKTKINIEKMNAEIFKHIKGPGMGLGELFKNENKRQRSKSVQKSRKN